jgi:TRAP transporter TAXI family solute receptor
MRVQLVRARVRVAFVAVAVAAVVVVAGSVAGETSGDPWAGERPDSLTIATGGASGIYHGYGAGLADVLTERYDLPVGVVETGGSIENLQLLADGTAQVAFSAADAVGDAVSGDGSFSEPLELSALARVYDDFVHLVVPAHSDIQAFEDLRGRSVSVGAPGSGTSLIASRLLEAADIDQRELRTQPLGLTRSIDELRAGAIDAFFWSGGLRTPGITDLADEVSVRLVPLGDLVDELRADHGSGYRHGVVPAGMYGQAQDVQTLAVPNFLVVRADMPEPVARALVSTLFDARSRIASAVPTASQLDPVRAIFTEPAALHPGALRFYRETKP